jgi:hypothetical protein
MQARKPWGKVRTYKKFQGTTGLNNLGPTIASFDLL